MYPNIDLHFNPHRNIKMLFLVSKERFFSRNLYKDRQRQENEKNISIKGSVDRNSRVAEVHKRKNKVNGLRYGVV